MTFHLEKTLRTLAEDYGDKGISRRHNTEYSFIPKDKRYDILLLLVKTAKKEGIEEEFFYKGTVQAIVAKAVFPDALTDTWHNKEKTLKSYKAAIGDLLRAVAKVWPSNICDDQSETEECDLPPINTKEWNPSIQGRIAPQVDRSIARNAPKPSGAEDPEAAAILGDDNE